MSRRVDFSRGAEAYDRRHGAVLPPDIAQSLIRVAGLRPGARVLDMGAGTGRVAVALAGLGCHVIGLEPARPMLESLRRKAAGLPVSAVTAEGAHQPFRMSSFDAAVVARLLYLLPDWSAAMKEVVRVVKPGGAVLHEWGNGHPDEEWVQIREKARALFERAGVDAPFHPGVRTEAEVHAFLLEEGFVPTGELCTPGEISFTLAEFLRRIVDGESSYTWDVPIDVQGACLPELTTWAAEQFDLYRPLAIPRDIDWRVYRKPVP